MECGRCSKQHEASLGETVDLHNVKYAKQVGAKGRERTCMCVCVCFVQAFWCRAFPPRPPAPNPLALLTTTQGTSAVRTMLCRWPSDTLKKCYSLCQHMMHFFHQYLLYVTFEVLEPLWHTMSLQCRAAKTLDEVHLPVTCLMTCPMSSHNCRPVINPKPYM